MVFDNDKKSEKRTFLVAIDFSDCARDALRQIKLFLAEKTRTNHRPSRH